MEIQALNAFIAVAETRSFSTAAEQLFLTQPAVSKRIANLESQLNTLLFDRIGREVSLTEAGRELLPRAQRILLEVEDARRGIGNLSGTISGTLTLGTSHHIGLHRLPPVLKRFNQEYPSVNLELTFMDSEAAIHAVTSGKLELGIVTLPTIKTELKTERIWEDELAVVVANNHPLANASTTSIKILAELPAVLPSDRTYTRSIIEHAFAKLDCTPQVRVTTNYLETLRMMVSVGLGWSILPTSMLNDSIHKLNVKELTLKRQLGIAIHPRRTLSNAGNAMIRLCRSASPN